MSPCASLCSAISSYPRLIDSLIALPRKFLISVSNRSKIFYHFSRKKFDCLTVGCLNSLVCFVDPSLVKGTGQFGPAELSQSLISFFISIRIQGSFCCLSLDILKYERKLEKFKHGVSRTFEIFSLDGIFNIFSQRYFRI